MDDDRLTEFGHEAKRAAEETVVPAWRRSTTGEQRWPSAVAILAMIGLQLALPDRLSLGPRWMLPAIEVVMIGVLMAANPGHLKRGTRALRMVALSLILVASLGNAWSIGQLVVDISTDRDVGNAAHLLGSGADVWLINVLTFAVWYWELDRGGALKRAAGVDPTPDFLFPQMTSPDLAAKDWEPEFLDYLYLAFTNSTAFSPTDTLPMSRWAKAVMGLQSLLSLMIVGLVVAGAVNELP